MSMSNGQVTNNRRQIPAISGSHNGRLAGGPFPGDHGRHAVTVAVLDVEVGLTMTYCFNPVM